MIKVILYEGSLNPPTFINVLLDQLIQGDFKVFLVGTNSKSKTSYSKVNANVITINTGVNKGQILRLLFCIYHVTKLLFINPLYFKEIYSKKLFGISLSDKLNQFVLSCIIGYVNADIVHIQWATHLKYFIGYFNTDKSVKPNFVLSLRGRLINVSPNVDKQIADLYIKYFPRINYFHAVSKAIAKEAIKWGAVEEKVSVVYSGLDLNRLSLYKKTSWNIGSPVTVLLVGRSHWKKGYRYALDALKILIDQSIVLNFKFIAGNPTEEEIYHLNDLNLTDYVTFLPNLNQVDVFRMYQSSDLFLLTSVEEGIANVVLEAMYIGLPVISSDCGGMVEVISNGLNGLIFENRNALDLVTQIKELIQFTPLQREAMAIQAQKIIQSQHSSNQLGHGIAKLYYDLIN